MEMNRRKWAALLAFVLAGGHASAQYFERIYDGPFGTADTAMSLVQGVDGGFYVAGTTSLNQLNDQYLIRTDAQGVQQWEGNWGGSTTSEYFREVGQRSTFGVVAAGNDRTTALSASNVTQWSNSDLIAGGVAHSNSVKQTSDGGTIACGTWNSGSDLQATLVKRNVVGDTLWTRKYGLTNAADKATSVVALANGGYAFIGLRSGAVSLTITNSTGAQTSTVSYSAYGLVEGGSGSFKGPFSLQQTADGGFVFLSKYVQGQTSNMRVMKTDAAGIFQWSYMVGGAESGPFGAVKQTGDGSYILTTGMRDTWDSELRLYLVRLSGTGVAAWSQYYQTGHMAIGTDVVQTASGFAVCGIIQIYPGSNTDMYLLHTDPNGMVGGGLCQLFGATNLSPAACTSNLVYTSTGGSGAFYVSLNDTVVSTTPAGSMPIAPGNYSFMITNVTNDGCIDSYEDSLFVGGPFVVNAGTDITACQTSAQMNGQVTPTGTYTYGWEPAWMFDDASVLNPNVVANVVNQTATLTVTDINGCSVYDDVLVTHAEADFSTYSLCDGPALLDFGPGGVQYQWQQFTDLLGNTTYINQNTQTYTATQPGTYLGIAWYVGCGALTSLITVEECSSCWNEFTWSQTGTSCGTQICLIGTASATPVSYMWNVAGNIFTNPSPCVSLPNGMQTVTLTTIDANGCTSIVTHQVPVTNSGLQMVLADTVTACFASATLLANVSGGSGSYSYAWSPAAGLNSATVANPQASYVHQQWYTVTVTDNNNGCTLTDSVLASSYLPLAEDTVYLCTDSVLLDMGPGGTFYNWGNITNNYLSQTAWVSQPGTYYVYAVFPNACTAITSQLTVLPCNDPCATDIVSTIQTVNCQSTVCVSPVGPSGITSSSWAFGDGGTSSQIQDCHMYTTGGIFTILGTFTYANGCTTQAYEIVTIPTGMTADIFQDTVACNGMLMGIGTNVTGSGNYIYNWTPPGLVIGPTQASVTINQVTVPTWIYVNVSDVQTGCFGSDSLLIYPNLPVVQTLDLCNGPVTLSLDPGSMIYGWNYTDLSGTTTTLQSGNPLLASNPGVYVCFTYYSGCNTITHTFTVNDCANDDVWPGDANSDNVVSNTDALWVGLAFNQTGPVRPAASLNWVGQPCPDWTFDFAANGVNLKHADCNGSGTVNFVDTVAITQNYLLTHNKVEDAAGGGPLLWVEIVQDTVGLSQNIDFTINLALPAIPVDSLHGLAFTLTFDNWLATQQGMYLNHNGNVLGNVGTTALSLQMPLFIDGAMDVALSRTTGINFNGSGVVATGRIVTTDNLSGIQEMTIGVSNIRAITAFGFDVTLSGLNDQVIIDPNKTAINEANTGPQFELQPNPANDAVLVLTATIGNHSIQVIDPLGRTVQAQSFATDRCLVDVSTLEAGSYLLRLHGPDGESTTARLVIVH